MISIRCNPELLPFMRDGDVLPVTLEVLGDTVPETRLHVRLMGIQGGIDSLVYDETTLTATSGSGGQTTSFEIRARASGTPILVISSPSRAFSEVTIRGSRSVRMPPSHGRSPGPQRQVPVIPRTPPTPPDVGRTLSLEPKDVGQVVSPPRHARTVLVQEFDDEVAPSAEGARALAPPEPDPPEMWEEDEEDTATVEPAPPSPPPLTDVYDDPTSRDFDLSGSEESVPIQKSRTLLWAMIGGVGMGILVLLLGINLVSPLLERPDLMPEMNSKTNKEASIDELPTPAPIELPSPEVKPCTQFKLLHGTAGGPERDGCYVMGCSEGYAAAWRLEHGSWQRCERYVVQQDASCVLITDSDGTQHAARFKNGQWTSAKCRPSN